MSGVKQLKTIANINTNFISTIETKFKPIRMIYTYNNQDFDTWEESNKIITHFNKNNNGKYIGIKLDAYDSTCNETAVKPEEYECISEY